MSAELLEHMVKMAMEAWDRTMEPVLREALTKLGDRGPVLETMIEALRKKHENAVRERLAQSAQVAACNLATNKDAAELLSAAEWLDAKGLGVLRVASVGRWDFGPHAYNRTPLAPAILAAARSLGWPGGGR